MSDNRSCTCHPDEAPKPCQRHFGLSECFMAAEIERLRAALREIAKHSRGGVIDTTEKMDRDEFIGIARAALEGK